MENLIENFVRVEAKQKNNILGRDRDWGDGYGDGYGCGGGYGGSGGSGDGGSGGDGSGCSCGGGDGCGRGWGDGYGYGYGWGRGCGCGWGRGDGIKTFNDEQIYTIDNVATIIKSVRGNIAQGFILQSDFTLTPCFVIKEGYTFAHGDTLHEAYEALQDKLYSKEPEEERIKKFKEQFSDYSKQYPAKELFHWHHILTGSCKAGRMAFCHDREIDIECDTFSIYEFINLTENSFGGDIIKKLRQQ